MSRKLTKFLVVPRKFWGGRTQMFMSRHLSADPAFLGLREILAQPDQALQEKERETSG